MQLIDYSSPIVQQHIGQLINMYCRTILLTQDAQGRLKIGGTRTSRSIPTLHNEWQKGQRLVKSGIELDVTSFGAYFRANCPRDEDMPKPEYDFLRPEVESIGDMLDQAMAAEGFKMASAGESITRRGVDTSYETLEAVIREYVREYDEESEVDGKAVRRQWGAGRVSDSLKHYVSNSDINSRKILKTQISTDSASQSQAYAYHMIQHVLDIWEVKEDRMLTTIVLMQWMWQTKRYALDMEVLEPLMVNINGVHQGTMKTSFIKALTRPFSDYRVLDAKLKSILDEREYTLWAKNYVIVFDELQKGRMDKHEFGGLITAIKSLLTSDHVGGRVMKTTTHVKMKRKFSAISSSNSSIINIIRDRTGMRRFFEFNVESKVRIDDRMVRVVNALLDMGGSDTGDNGYCNKVWKSIDEYLPNGYLGVGNFKEQLYAVQDQYKIIDNTDLWLESGDIRDVPVRFAAVNPEGLMWHVQQFDAVKDKQELDALNRKIDPYRWILDYKLLKECTDWVEAEIGRNASQYVGGREQFLAHLNSAGIVTRLKGSEVYVLCSSLVGVVGETPGGLQ